MGETKSKFNEAIRNLLRQHKRKVWWKRGLSAMMAVVVFCTTYSLILNAITQESNTFCGYEQHIHSESCYTDMKTLACELPANIRFVLAETAHDGYTALIKETVGTAEMLIVSGDTTETLTLNSDRDFTVYNNPGTALPETGGIGTTIFYVAGSVLLVGALVLLVVKRSMKNRDD